MRVLVLAALLTTLAPGDALAQRSVTTGSYLCTVEQIAGIGTSHLEGAPPPSAFAGAERYRFRLTVTAEPTPGRFRVVEAPYDGPDASRAQWEDDNSTLHAPYVGDGRAFTAEGAPGILSFGRDGWGEALQFYHAGYQYAGGEDESLSVRWGRCAREE
jgi:hypothetical protein